MQKQWQVSRTQETKARPEAIWHRWEMVEHWPEEDNNLEWARLEGEFVVGSKITMKPKGSPKSSVVIKEMIVGKSYTTEGKIPFGKLIISHKVEKLTEKHAAFTHTLTLTGPLRKLFVRLFAQKLANDLPEKMQNIARLAEAL